MTGFRRRLVGLLATLSLIGIVVGLPLVLLAVGAESFPRSLPSLEAVGSALTGPDDGTLALGFVQVLGWASWAFLTASILLEVISRARGVSVPRVPGLPQGAIRGLVSAAALLFVMVPLVAQPAAAVAAASATPVTVSAAAQWSPTEAPEHHGTTSPTQATPVASSTPEVAASTAENTHAAKQHTVSRGETLWSIAVQHLGVGTRYTEIAALNTDVLGDRPGFLQPGWTLRLPTDRTSAPETPQTYTVQRGDTLSEIAQEQLGEASRYPEIFEASRATTQPSGAHLADPDVIDIGWTLTIPSPSATEAQTQVPRAAPSPSAGQDQPSEANAATQSPQQVGPGTEASTPTASSAPTAAASSAPAVPGTGDQLDTVASDDTPDAEWMLAGLTGAGTILAGSLLLLLRRRRRDQARARRPGRTIAVPDAVLGPVEKTVIAAGAVSAPTVEWIDTVLRRLAARWACDDRAMPELVAVEVAHTNLVLHLGAPCELPGPWEDTGDRMHWSCRRDVDVDEVGPAVEDQPAPYPLLVTIGMSDAEEKWLLNCEALGAISITGDPAYGHDFARYLAAELACHPWSQEVTVDCVGVAEEIAAMNPHRVRFHPVENDAAAEVLTEAVAMVDRTTAVNLDTATARAAQLGDDTWPSRLLLLAAADEEPRAVAELLRLVEDHSGRAGTAVVVTGERADTPGVALHVGSNGRVRMPRAGLDLVAVGLTSDEARGSAALLAAGEDLQDIEIPRDEESSEGWQAYADAAGALRREHTVPRGTPAEDLDEPAESVLTGADEDYRRAAAATQEDLDTLAPQVPVRVRTEVEETDPTLDADLAAWFSEDCDLPRLMLLGPVTARTRGNALAVANRKPFYTEMLAYLALRPHGATPSQVAEAFGLTVGRTRTDIKVLRDWLGTNPRTGDRHLPDALKSPAGKLRGIGVYQVDSVLVDAHLFRRLRVRGESRGADGIADLRRALTLVQGKLFDQQREGGWSWLGEGDRLDHHMVCAIVDVAHLVTTYELTDGDLTRARAAAEIAALAAPHEEIPRLDLAAVAAAAGHGREAERILREDVCDRSDDGLAPMELSERTKSIIRSHDWLAGSKAAS